MRNMRQNLHKYKRFQNYHGVCRCEERIVLISCSHVWTIWAISFMIFMYTLQRAMCKLLPALYSKGCSATGIGFYGLFTLYSVILVATTLLHAKWIVARQLWISTGFWTPKCKETLSNVVAHFDSKLYLSEWQAVSHSAYGVWEVMVQHTVDDGRRRLDTVIGSVNEKVTCTCTLHGQAFSSF